MAFPLEIIPSAIGAIGSLFNNEEDERQRRYQQYLGLLRRMKQQDIERTTTRTSGLVAGARQAAKARAAAAGRTGDAEAYILPAEQGAIHEGSLALDRTIQPYNQQELSSEQDFANRPIQPGLGDFLSEAGGAVGNYLQNKRYLDIIGKYGGGTQSKPPMQEIPYEDVTNTDQLDELYPDANPNYARRRRRNLMLTY